MYNNTEKRKYERIEIPYATKSRIKLTILFMNLSNENN